MPKSRAIVLLQCGQCRWVEGMKGRLIRAQTTQRKRISCKGQLFTGVPPPPLQCAAVVNAAGPYAKVVDGRMRGAAGICSPPPPLVSCQCATTGVVIGKGLATMTVNVFSNSVNSSEYQHHSRRSINSHTNTYTLTPPPHTHTHFQCAAVVNAAGPYAKVVDGRMRGAAGGATGAGLPVENEVHAKAILRDSRLAVPADAPMVRVRTQETTCSSDSSLCARLTRTSNSYCGV